MEVSATAHGCSEQPLPRSENANERVNGSRIGGGRKRQDVGSLNHGINLQRWLSALPVGFRCGSAVLSDGIAKLRDPEGLRWSGANCHRAARTRARLPICPTRHSDRRDAVPSAWPPVTPVGVPPAGPEVAEMDKAQGALTGTSATLPQRSSPRCEAFERSQSASGCNTFGRSHSSSLGGLSVSDSPLFKAAFPYQQDVLALPVVDLDVASHWYANAFGLREVDRIDQPLPTVILERDGIKIGFAVNGGDASQEGAAILVSDIDRARQEIEAAGIEIGNWRIDEHDGEKRQVFFVVAPDGLCYYFYQPIST